MYLKSIELYGFKSFAERTKIELNENITCIVGPNGSGKSNITDAIRWVLGEQSTITLRGSKMQDIIFSGTNKRRALGMAEVIITFDNSSNTLDLNYNEIEVKRKFYKNGDSEYYINNSLCRLKDVRELFMDTGIGRDGYSIIGQGRIDAILNSKPQERRAIFEEASGISKFKSQKNDVERKLKHTKENITRLSDLLTEVENQKENLAIEAKKAESYNEIYYEILKGEIVNLTLDLKNIKEKSLEYINEKRSIEGEKKEHQNKIEKLQKEFDDVKSHLESVENEINELQITNVENVRLENDLSSKISIHKEKLSNTQKEIESIDNQLNKNIEEIENSEKELANNVDRYNNLCELKEKYVLENESKLSDFNLLENEYSNTLKDMESIQSDVDKIDQEISQLTVRIDTLKSLNSEREISISNISKDFTRLENNKSETDSSLDDIKIKLSNMEKNLSDDLKTLNEFKVLYSKEKNEELKLENDNRNILGEINSTKLRISTLENLEETYEGYNKSIRDFYRFIKKQKINISELHNTVANLIKVRPVYEKAITIALGGSIQNLVVTTYKSAQNIIELLKRENLGRITFLPLDNIKDRSKNIIINNEGFVDFAVNLVDFDETYKTLFGFLLGNIVVAKNLDYAKEISESGNKYLKIVTLDGDILNPGGSVSGGSFKMSGNIFNRKNQLDSLKKKLSQYLEELSKSKSSIEYNKESIEKLDLKINSLNEKIFKSNETKTSLEKKIIEINYSIENNSKKIEEYKFQLEDYNLKIDKTKNDILNLENDKNIKLKTKNELIDKLNNKNNDLKKLEIEKSDQTNNINKDNLKIGNIENEIIFIQKDISRIESLINKLVEEKKDLKNTNTAKIDDISKFNEKIETFEKQLQKVISINQNFKNNLNKISERKKSIMTKYNSYSDSISDVKDELLEMDKNLYFIDQNLSGNYDKETSIIEYVGETYKYSLLEELTNVSLDKVTTKSKIKKLKQDLNNLGIVNLGSIKSYKEVKERYDFTKKQYEDLIESEEKLRELLRKIEKTMEEKFSKSFEIINKNFNRIFNYLFDGGKAELIIEDSDDPIYSGIDILAQLPGKKRQLLNAMSGGERSMTTVALLFALLETRPSPFCLLDEVDAALDEANIKRFLSYLKNLENIQFAIITHRKSTMAAANYIYGITMEEPGISKVISLNFDRRKGKNVQVV